MSQIEQHRKRIDEIDTTLIRLLDERADIARAVGQTKAEGGLNTYDSERQRAVMSRAVERSTGSFPRDGLFHVMREVLSACLNLQKPLRVGFLGPLATFSHQAAIAEFGHSVRFESHDSIREMFASLQAKTIDHAVVPVENSTGGIIHETIDSFLEFDAMICAEVLLAIEQCVIGRCEIPKIRRLYSHKQVFAQCARWLRENMPGVELVEVASTSRAMEMVRTRRTAAALGGAVAAEQYGLRVLEKGIEDLKDNTTRFLVIAERDSRVTGDDRTSITIGLRDRTGALYHALQIFAELKVNLTKIESRPSRKNPWEQMFFIDMDGHRSEPHLAEAIKRLQDECAEVRVLGSYAKGVVPERG
jgi:chorismate mutase/prephenate dehydratase